MAKGQRGGPASGPWAIIGRATIEWRTLTAVQVAAQRAGGLWAASCDRKEFFLWIFFIELFLFVFCSDFEQISNSFLYSNYFNEKFV
jgi:hypothetical protein